MGIGHPLNAKGEPTPNPVRIPIHPLPDGIVRLSQTDGERSQRMDSVLPPRSDVVSGTERAFRLCQRRISVSHQVRLEDDVYERIKSRKRDEETFSEAIDRLTSEWTLLDFPDDESPVDPDDLRTLLARSEETGTEETRARLERLGIDSDG